MKILKIWFQYKLSYCLIILVLHWKVLISDFWERLILCKKPMSLFKKRRLPGAPAKGGFTILPWNFVRVLYIAIPVCGFFFCFVLVLFSKIYQFRKNTIFLTLFCKHFYGERMRKISEKNNNLYWVGTLRNFDLFRWKT